MGKNRSTVSGLSRFLQVLKESDSADVPLPPASLATAAVQGPDSKHDSPDQDSEVAVRPTKKRKIGLLGAGYEQYDATSLVQFYTHQSEVPNHLKKYFFQRTRYFSLYDSGCLLDEEGWYSVTPERIADQIAERCRCDTIVDAFCGVGGNAIAFAKTCERVIAIDNSPTRLSLARHNATIYGVVDRIEFILADYISFARSHLLASFTGSGRKIDVIFLSPPWGGPSYLAGSPENSDPPDSMDGSHPSFRLSDIKPIHGAELFELSKKITPNIAYFLPRNTDLEEASALARLGTGSGGGGKEEMVEVEEEWMGDKLKALTCYYGGLAQGQEHLF